MLNWKSITCWLIGHKRGFFYYRQENERLYAICRRCDSHFTPHFKDHTP